MGRVILWIQGCLCFDRLILYILKISASWHFRKGWIIKEGGRLFLTAVRTVISERHSKNIFWFWQAISVKWWHVSIWWYFEKDVRCSRGKNHYFSGWLKQYITFDFWIHLVSSNLKASFLLFLKKCFLYFGSEGKKK